MDFLANQHALLTASQAFRFSGTDLANELNKVASVTGRSLPDAVAFYAGRIVEVSVEDSVKRLGYRSADSVAEHLDLIGMSPRIDDGYLACGNALRRISNHARHMDRPILDDEEATIIAMLQLWLEWYWGFIGQNVMSTEGTSVLRDWSTMTPTMRILVRGNKNELQGLVNSDGSLDSHLFDEATIAAFIGERLTDAQLPAAEAVTQNAVYLFQKDKRLRQVRALFLSRNDRSEDAVFELNRVLRWKYGQDSETLGILGGAYKNLWMKNGVDSHLLEAHRCYASVPQDGKTNYYLLINAAATALWLGRLEDARSCAFQAVEALKKFGVTEKWALSANSNYWLVATLAEAQLIWGKTKSACNLYARAKAIDKTEGRWMRTCEQLKIHLRFLPDIRFHMTDFFDEKAK